MNTNQTTTQTENVFHMYANWPENVEYNSLQGWENEKQIVLSELKTKMRWDKICRLYDKAYTKQLQAKKSNDTVDFWRMMTICLRILKWKNNFKHN